MIARDGRGAGIAVIGGGPAGLAAALLLAAADADVVLIAPRREPDRRTTALLGASAGLLRRAGAWDGMAEAAAPLAAIRIVDATGQLIRAPEVRFDAAELGLDAFGYNVPNAALMAALEAAIAARGLPRIAAPATGIEPGEDGVQIAVGSGEVLRVRLAVAADGRASATRAAAGIAVRERRYPQTALVANFSHEVPHDGVSTEFHTPAGPLTLVPLPGRRSSLVWVTSPREAERLAALAADRLGAEVEAGAHSLLGAMAPESAVQLFPLGRMTAERFAARRIALTGETAHVLPPIGAQGLNLALRDAGALADLAGGARDPGDPGLLATYDRRRRGDIRLRSAAVDALNRSLLSGILPVQLVRSLGLFAAAGVPAVRRLLMRAGLGA